MGQDAALRSFRYRKDFRMAASHTSLTLTLSQWERGLKKERRARQAAPLPGEPLLRKVEVELELGGDRVEPLEHFAVVGNPVGLSFQGLLVLR